MYNDTRGGDSCGIFIDGKYEYGTGAMNKYFEGFMIPAEGGSKLLQETTTATIAIGHCRKASVGKVIDETTAQPVILKEGDKITYVLMHNGTIYNYKELAKKYIPEIDITGMTDSQVMARIFYHAGYNALDEYYGGATFFILDYRNGKKYPKILMFRGCSKKTNYGTETKVEERGLHLAVKEGELVFSSEAKYLNTLRYDSYQCYPVDNMLVEWDGKKLVPGKIYPRDNVSQTAPPTPINNTPAVSNTAVYPHMSGRPNLVGNVSTPNSTVSTFKSPFVNCELGTGRCRRGDCYLHGMVKISTFGKVITGEETTVGTYYSIWFWAGIMLKNYECFKFLQELTIEIDGTPIDTYNCYPELVMYLSPYPFFKNSKGQVVKVNSALEGSVYSGKLFWPFISTEYTYVDGVYETSEIKTCAEALKAYEDHKDDKIDFSDFIDLV